jgi:hypothetical protein
MISRLEKWLHDPWKNPGLCRLVSHKPLDRLLSKFGMEDYQYYEFHQLDFLAHLINFIEAFAMMKYYYVVLSK